eukprot:scaffold69566_cov47-Phaeocystis_antarctica.AAC.2
MQRRLVSNSTLLACTLSTLLVSPGNCACGGDQVTSWLSAQMHVQDVTLSGRVAQACACTQMTLWPGCDAVPLAQAAQPMPHAREQCAGIARQNRGIVPCRAHWR